MNTRQTARPQQAMSRKRVLRISGSIAVGAGTAVMVAGALAGWSQANRIGIFLLAMGGVWLAFSLFASREPLHPRHRRFLREFYPAIVAYMVLVFAYRPLLGLVELPLLRAAIALLPVLPIVFVVRAMVRKLRDSDELEQRMQLEAVSIASISVGLLSFALAFLGTAGVFHLGQDQPLMLVLPALIVGHALALRVVRRRYQGP